MTASIRDVVECIRQDTNLDGFENLKWEVGRKQVKKNSRPPRVVWIPIAGPIAPPDDVGGRLVGTEKGRQIATRVQGFEVHVQGCDIDETELLSDAVVAACWRSLSRGSVVFGDHTWTTQTPDGADFAVDGEKIVLTLQIKIPIPELPTVPTVLVAATSTSVSFGFASFDWDNGTWGSPRTWGTGTPAC
jgi:hypothetical protein